MIWKNEIDNGTRLNRKTSDVERGKNTIYICMVYIYKYIFGLKPVGYVGGGVEGVRVKYKLEKAFLFYRDLFARHTCYVSTDITPFVFNVTVETFLNLKTSTFRTILSLCACSYNAYGVRSDEISSPFRRPLPGPTVLNGYGAANLRFAVSRSPGDNVTFPFVGWRGEEETVYENEYVSAAV